MNRRGSPLIILADHVRWDAGGLDAVKFLARLGGASGSATMSDTGPIPEGKTRLADVFSVTARSGEYAEGASIPVATYKGTTYSLLVESPER